MATETKAEFPKGIRVMMKPDARNQFPQRKSYCGVVVGHSRNGRFLRIHWDGNTIPSTAQWSPLFFEAEQLDPEFQVYGNPDLDKTDHIWKRSGHGWRCVLCEVFAIIPPPYPTPASWRAEQHC